MKSRTYSKENHDGWGFWPNKKDDRVPKKAGMCRIATALGTEL